MRAEALSQLERAPRRSLSPLVRSTLDDRAWRVRRAAVRTVRAAGDGTALPLLVERLVDESALLRAEARRALVELFGSRLPAAAADHLTGTEARLRRTLVYLLSESCGAAAAATVAGLEHDPDPGVRIAVAKGLAGIPTLQAAQAVERLRADPDPDVRNAVDVALAHVASVVNATEMVDAPHAGAGVRTEDYRWSDYLGATRPVR